MSAAPPDVSAATIEMTRALIAFATVSRDSNLGLIEWTRDYLARLGVKSQLTYDRTGAKANLFATLGERPGPGVVLSGHSDVVPVDGQDWDSDPFAAQVREAKLFGRGAADMKGFLATVLAHAPQLAEMNEGEPVHLAISYDEEVGCVGVRGLLKDLEERGLKPRGCIIGEPSGMEVVVGHKAGHAFTCTVTGRAAHAALAPFGVNAIEYAARLIVRLREIADRLALDETRHPGFEVPYSTITTGVIQGGVAGNIVPKDCRFRFGVRALPWTDPAAIVAEIEQYSRDVLLPRMRDVAPESDIVIEQTGEVPAMDLNEDAPLVRYAQRLSGSSRRPGYIGLGSEGGLFQRAGIPAVICGPGSIDQAHKPNEFVTLEQLALCERFILEVTRRPPGPQCEAV